MHLDISPCIAVENESTVSVIGVDSPFEVIRPFKDQITVTELVNGATIIFISRKSNAVRSWIIWIINDVKIGVLMDK